MAEIVVLPSATATLAAGFTLERPDCFFRAKSKKLSDEF
jgi:hypothetical protein